MNLFIDFRPVHQIIPTDFEGDGAIVASSIEGLDFDAVVDLITKVVQESPGTIFTTLIFDTRQLKENSEIINKIHANLYSYIIATADNKVQYSVIDYSRCFVPSEEYIDELGPVTVVPIPWGGEFEYYLHTWGGIYNENTLETKYGIVGQDFWFKTEEERTAFIKLLQGYAKDCGECLVYAEEEGTDVRFKPVATMTLTTPDGKTCKHRYEAWYGYYSGHLLYHFVEGNHSCDCNRSLDMRRSGVDIKMYACGSTIKVSDFVVTFTR